MQMQAFAPCVPLAVQRDKSSLSESAGSVHRQRGLRPRATAAGIRRRSVVLRAAPDGQGDDGQEATSPWSQASAQVELPPQPFYQLAIALAGAGALENAYLTFNKLAGVKPALCAAGGGCEATLSSVYSELFGLPLSLFGAGAYAAVGLVAAAALAAASDPDPLVRLQRPDKLRWLFLGGSTMLFSVSAYLMTVLATKIGQPCPYCVTSAALSAGILFSNVPGFRPEEVQKQGTALAAVALTTVTLLAVPQMRAADRAQAIDIPFKEPEIIELADDRAKALALHLEKVGAKMYGAFCHCLEQKELFGSGAKVPYVECYPEGYRTGVKARTKTVTTPVDDTFTPINPSCDLAKVEGFPTWIINGERIEGSQPLEKLAELSGFAG